ncbi:hypothetical protein FQR65_LT12071 [Abscondita terminalis]|nr:hypothetical protein FQR65_LT12071 [Abscondita terminalis]
MREKSEIELKFIGQNEKISKINRYWAKRSIIEIIDEADNLFLGEKYLEVYELLNRLKFGDNVEIHWRLCRALFKMSCNKNYTHEVHREMIIEAYNLIEAAIQIDPNNANIHKWMAIITDTRASLDGTANRIKSYETVKGHLLRASELNPEDVAVLYMLGRWCYQISSISWLQRKISSLLFETCPISSYEEAHGYFAKAEQLQPRFYLPNLYMLGCTNFHLKQMFRAKYYLNIASKLTPRNSDETDCAASACKLGNSIFAL